MKVGLVGRHSRTLADGAARTPPHAEPYVSALSLWALVSGHWSAWQAARVEVYQQQEDIAGDVVQRVVEETDVKPA